MTDRARELLERAYGELAASDTTTGLLKEIRDFLSTPEPTQGEEPVAWFSQTSRTFSTVETSHHTAPLFLHPAPRPEFVRLSEEEMADVLNVDPMWFHLPNLNWNSGSLLEYARAIEDALEEKNRG